MATLQNVQGGSLVPDLTGSLNQLLQGFGTRGSRAREDEAARQAKLKSIDTEDLLDVIETGSGKERDNALARLAVIQGPQITNQIRQILESGDQRKQLQLQQKNDQIIRDTLQIQSITDPALRMVAFRELASEPGRDPDEIREFIRMANLTIDEQNAELSRDRISATDTKTLLDQNFKREQARLKLVEFESVLNEKGEVVGQRNKLTGKIEKNPLATGGDGVAEKGTFTKGTGLIVQNDDGSTSFLTPVTDSRTGATTFQKSEVPGEIVSRQFGETGGQETVRKIGQARGVKEAQLGAEAEGIGAVRRAEVTSKGRATRAQTRIAKGIEAGSSLPILNRGIDLLGSVKTGGFDAVRLRAKQLFGIESADEAELASNVGKAVLQQLRSTFGAAFTEGEGRRLERIEANIGKSTAGNIRLLKQAKKIALDAAKRGLRQARAQGDKESVAEIQDFIDFNLGEGLSAVSQAPAAQAGGIGDLRNLPLEELLSRVGK